MAELLPSPTKKRRPQHTNYEQCIKCQTVKDEPLNNVTRASYNTILTVIKAKSDGISRRLEIDIQNEDDFFRNNPKWHRTWRATWTSITNIAPNEPELTFEKACPVTRALTPTFDYQHMCVICGKVKLSGKRKHQTLSRVETVSVQETIYINAIDKPDHSILLRIQGDCEQPIDMVAKEVRYHKHCYDSLRHSSKPRTDVNPYNAAFDILIDEISDKIQMGKLYHISTLRDMYQNRLIDAGLDNNKAEQYTNYSLKFRLQCRFGNQIVFIPQTGPVSDIVCNAELSAAELLKAWQTLKRDVDENYIPVETDGDRVGVDSLDSETKLAFRVAQKVTADMKDLKAKFRRDKSEHWNVTFEQALEIVPVSLYNLIAFLISDASFDETDSAGRVLIDRDIAARSISLSTHETVLNRAQDILYAATGVQTPHHVGLAVHVYHKTRSKDVITVLNRLGLCISYDELQRLLTSVAIEINEQSGDDDVFIPSNIVPKQFTQFAIDNLDFSECTLDGSSMHVTSMVMFQKSTQEKLHGCAFANVPTNISRRRSLQGTSCEHSLQSLVSTRTFKTLKRKMTTGVGIDVNKLLEQYVSEMPNINLCWNLLRLCPTKLLEVEVDCPSLKAFQATLTDKQIPLTSIGYCPFLRESPTNADVVSQALKICMRTSQKLGITHTVVTQDEAIYEIRYTIRKNNLDEYSGLILRLGGFHLLMNYLGAVGKIMRGSGLKELFTNSKILKDGTAEKVLSGKGYYYQAVNSHMRVYETLVSLRWEAFEEWVIGQGLDLDIMAEISDVMTILGDQMDNNDSMASLTVRDFDKYLDHVKMLMNQMDMMKQNSNTWIFWMNYISMIETLLSFIHAERAGVWQEHLSATARMAEYIASADHVKYIKAVVCYLEEMRNLPIQAPHIQEEFDLGHFTVKRSTGVFNSIWTDMGLECSQNCDAKGRPGQAGLRGVTMNSCVQEKWFRTLPFTAAISSVMKEMLNIHETDGSHHDDNRATKKRELVARDRVISTMKNGDIINPFTYTGTDLVRISDGMVATEKVVNDLINASTK